MPREHIIPADNSIKSFKMFGNNLIICKIVILILANLSNVLGSERQARALPFPDSGTVGVSIIKYCLMSGNY